MKKISCLSLLLVLSPFLVSAQLSGPLSGTLGPGTFTVVGDISVNLGDTLTILPGTSLEFETGIDFTINGFISARGTVQDSVRFLPAQGSYGWGGLDFAPSAPDSSILEYCLITGSNSSGIFMDGVSPVIAHCAIAGNQSGSNGGGMNCYNGAAPSVRACVFENNSASIIGGGVRATASMLFTDCLFQGNSSFKGGGAYCEEAEFERCRFIGNSSGSDGGGIYFASNGTIDSSQFTNNSAGDEGGGFYLSSGAQITATLVDSNRAVKGGGMFCLAATILISECAIIGNSASGDGGGIYAEAEVTINNCQIQGNWAMNGGGLSLSGSAALNMCGISGNTAFFKGGGMNSEGGFPEITSCVFNANSADTGAGVNTAHGDFSLCEFIGNSAGRLGGGMYFTSTCAITNCLFIDNRADFGGGAAISAYQQNVNNCTFTANQADSAGGGLYRAGGYYRPNANDCVIWGNSPDEVAGDIRVRYCALSDTGITGIGNIYDDPLFVDPAGGDFHLQSTTGSWHGGQWLPDPAHSPCIDAGNPNANYSGEPAPNGDRLNMGAYGNTSQASLSIPSGIKSPEESWLSEFALLSAYPNPFNQRTDIRYQLQAASHVKLAVYDITGREVASLVNGHLSAGRHEFAFDATELASGVYFAMLEAGGVKQVRKLLLVK